jgi:hypothetical protein
MEDAAAGASAPTVLFIGGYGRSGSTLLDRVLGSTDGLFSAGEIRHVFLEGYVENRLCGCNEPFRECPFWREVTARAFGPIDEFDASALLTIKQRVDRYWRIPQIVSGRGSARRRAELALYGSRLRSLYEAVAAVSGATVIVDSSKDVSHGYVLGSIRPALDLRVLHLIRDSRAVAHSWQRKKFNPGSGEDMERYSLLRTSAEWVAINSLTALQRRLGRPYLRLRYEDFVAAPRAALAEVLELVGERRPELPVSPQGEIELAPSHTVAGNPMRFASGSTRIRGDQEWRRRMPRRSRGLVTTLTLPVLAAHGFLGGSGG